MNLIRQQIGFGSRFILSFLEKNDLKHATDIARMFPIVDDWRALSEEGTRKKIFSILQESMVLEGGLIFHESSKSSHQRYALTCKNRENGYCFTGIDVYCTFAGIDPKRKKNVLIYTPSIIIPRGVPLSNYGPYTGNERMLHRYLPSSYDGSLDTLKDELRELSRLATKS